MIGFDLKKSRNYKRGRSTKHRKRTNRRKHSTRHRTRRYRHKGGGGWGNPPKGVNLFAGQSGGWGCTTMQ